jgi:hypothetical protein
VSECQQGTPVDAASFRAAGFRLLTPEAFESNDPWDLARIHEARFHLGVWSRTRTAFPEIRPFPALRESGVILRNDRPFRLEESYPAWFGKVRVTVPEDVLRDWDVLVGLFGLVTRSGSCSLRIEEERTDACHLFHRDFVGIRMLCTYLGPGTEWVPEAFVDRAGLGREDNGKVVLDFSQVRRCGTGDVVLLKGESYPGNEGRGVIHRSPAIECCGETRVVLRITEESRFQ